MGSDPVGDAAARITAAVDQFQAALPETMRPVRAVEEALADAGCTPAVTESLTIFFGEQWFYMCGLLVHAEDDT